MTTPTTREEFVAEAHAILDGAAPFATRELRAKADAERVARKATPKPAPKKRAAKSKVAASKTPTAKADPSRVQAYLDSTGLNRKELAAVLGKSVGLIAHVTRATGDRWSVDRFSQAIDAIERHLKSKKVERPGNAAPTPAAMVAFLVPEGDAPAPKPKAKPARKAKAAR